MGKKPNKDVIDHKRVYQDRLVEARTKLQSLAGGLELTETLATDLMVIRQTRLVIDDCKRRLTSG